MSSIFTFQNIECINAQMNEIEYENLAQECLTYEHMTLSKIRSSLQGIEGIDQNKIDSVLRYIEKNTIEYVSFYVNVLDPNSPEYAFKYHSQDQVEKTKDALYERYLRPALNYGGQLEDYQRFDFLSKFFGQSS